MYLEDFRIYIKIHINILRLSYDKKYLVYKKQLNIGLCLYI